MHRKILLMHESMVGHACIDGLRMVNLTSTTKQHQTVKTTETIYIVVEDLLHHVERCLIKSPHLRVLIIYLNYEIQLGEFGKI